MKRFFLAHPLLVGAVAGVLFFSATELLAAGVRWVWMERFPGSSYQFTAGLFAALGAAKALVFGVLLGRICGLAAREWLCGERQECKRMLCTVGWTVVGIFGVLLSFSLPGVAHLFFNTTLSWQQKGQEILEAIFATFPLQISILLLGLSRYLPDNSAKTTQITQNLRL